MREGKKAFKKLNKINKSRDLSPKTEVKKNDSYNNINDKSTNSKLNNFSSMKKKNNSKKKYPLKSESNKMLFEEEEENKDYEILATNVRIQNKILDEYQNWTYILLSVIDSKNINNNYNDIGTPIQQGLENIEKIKNENLEIKTLIIKKRENNDKTQRLLDIKHKTQNMIIKEFNEKDKNKEINLKKEKDQLISNVQMLANELDDLNENNKQLYDKIQKDEKLQKIYELCSIRNHLKEENELYKKIMEFKNMNEYIDLETSFPLSSNNFKIIDLENKKIDKRNKSWNNMKKRDLGSKREGSGYGEYKLEKEENIKTTDSIFFCGP